MKIKKGDTVVMRSGKDKNKQGKILRVDQKLGKIVVEGLNIRIKHQKPRRSGEKGSRVEIPSLVPASRVMLVCPKCGKPTRVGYAIQGETKARVCRKCNAEL